MKSTTDDRGPRPNLDVNEHIHAIVKDNFLDGAIAGGVRHFLSVGRIVRRGIAFAAKLLGMERSVKN